MLGHQRGELPPHGRIEFLAVEVRSSVVLLHEFDDTGRDLLVAFVRQFRKRIHGRVRVVLGHSFPEEPRDVVDYRCGVAVNRQPVGDSSPVGIPLLMNQPAELLDMSRHVCNTAGLDSSLLHLRVGAIQRLQYQFCGVWGGEEVLKVRLLIADLVQVVDLVQCGQACVGRARLEFLQQGVSSTWVPQADEQGSRPRAGLGVTAPFESRDQLRNDLLAVLLQQAFRFLVDVPDAFGMCEDAF